ncbi:MAG: hypothetical protein LBR61_13680 [Synergistaceae bacterium]|jgi:hypothetical protein|nr:hypothetical protein [Synergistaceae bacterium]
MSGVYIRNELCGDFQGLAEEELPVLEDEVCADRALEMSVEDRYEAAIENCWADFIKDFYV